MFSQPILFVGAHPDDIEIFAGGTVARLLEEGKEVHLLLVSHAKMPRSNEFISAVEQLGFDVKLNRWECFPFEDTRMHLQETEILQYIEKYIRLHNINTVFTHHPHDSHPDHRTVGNATIAAARNIDNVLFYQPSYPSGRTVIPFSPDIVVKLTQDQLGKKIEALRQHRSQIVKYGEHEYLDAVIALAKANLMTMTGGLKGGAEVFQINRIVY